MPDAPAGIELPTVPRPSPRQWLQLGAAALVLLVYPLVSAWMIERLGIRGAGLLLTVVIGPVFAFTGQRIAAGFGARAPASFAPIVLAFAAAVTGDRVFLKLVPAAVHLVLFELFRASLRGPMSMIELGARVMEPYAPEFISSYCRKLTVLWCAFFLTNALVIAVLAIWFPLAWWSAYTGWVIYAALGALSVLEFLVRKWWFRYYFNDTVFDRVWSVLFPAEATPQGRRSAEYVRRTREQLRREGISK